MPALRCPKCRTVVRVGKDATVVCPDCGFQAANPLLSTTPPPKAKPPAAKAVAAKPASQVTATSRAEATPQPPREPMAEPGEPPKPARPFTKRPLVAAAISLVVVLVVIGSLLALGRTGGAGGDVTQEQLVAALSQLASGSNASSEPTGALGIEGTIQGVSEDGEGVPLSVTFRMVRDPGSQEYELSYRAEGAGAMVDASYSQVGRVINFEQAGKTFEGRDEDPSTLPAFLGVNDIAALTTTATDLLQGADVVVESREGARLHGEAATKFVVTSPEASGQEATVWVYDDSLRMGRIQFESQGSRATMDFLYGRDLDVRATTGHPRASFVMGGAALGGLGGPDPAHCEFHATPGASCVVPDDHFQEVRLNEVELRVAELEGASVLSMRADVKSLTGDGVSVSYEDVDADGFLSAGDRYSYDFGDRLLVFQFYDLWADQPAGGPVSVPGPGLALLLLGVLVPAAYSRRRE